MAGLKKKRRAETVAAVSDFGPSAVIDCLTTPEAGRRSPDVKRTSGAKAHSGATGATE
jgi:hypothetical protein